VKRVTLDPAFVRESIESQARQKSDAGLLENIAFMRTYLGGTPDPAMAESDAQWLAILEAEHQRRQERIA
jgi:hypothetical protein